jgi:superfamily II DNA or RNA helicase
MVLKNTIISQGGYVIPLKSIKKDTLENLKQKLIAKPFASQGIQYGKDTDDVNEYNVYIEDTHHIKIPRYFGIQEFGNIPIDNSSIKASHFKFTGSLRDYQINITNICYKHLKEKYGGILSVPCGRGKTTMALYLASLFKMKTLVLVHKGFLLDQWVARIKEFTDAKVGILRQDKIDTQDKDIVVGMIQSISMKDYDMNIFKEFGTVIVDETHHIVSKTFSKALFKLGCMYTIGLSATPKRADGLSYLLNWFLGDIMYQEGARVNTKVVAKIFNYKSSDPLFIEQTQRIFKNGKSEKVPNFVKMVSNLCNLDERTNHIFNIMTEIIHQNSDRKILVLSARLEHLAKFKDCADTFIASNIYEEGEHKPITAYYVGDTKQKDRQFAEENADIIFSTYDMAQEALDIKRLNTLILTTPKKDVEQSIGRIMRKEKIEDGDVRPLIIDFRDVLSIFDTHGKKREKFYKKNLYKVKHYYLKNRKLVTENRFNNDDCKEKIKEKLSEIILDIDNPDYIDDDPIEDEICKNKINEIIQEPIKEIIQEPIKEFKSIKKRINKTNTSNKKNADLMFDIID